VDKHYKFSANDVRERRNWDAYQEAYEDAVNLTSTPWAPWHVVPSDHKWYRNLVVARIVCSALEALDPRWPDAPVDGVTLEELDQEAASVSSSR
jgi:polyphosphate kinase 2 (PPK2 family)